MKLNKFTLARVVVACFLSQEKAQKIKKYFYYKTYRAQHQMEMKICPEHTISGLAFHNLLTTFRIFL